MRSAVVVTAWLASLPLLVSCATAPPAPKAPGDGAPPVAAPQAAEAVQPKRGGVYTYAGASPPNNLHPYPIASSGQRRVVGPVYETLVAFKAGPDFDYQDNFATIPWLAESWDQLDKSTYVFRIRKGVRWQDGEEFTGADVKFSFDYARDPANKFVARSLVDDIGDITLGDPYTVRVTLEKPNLNLLVKIADFNAMVLPKHVYDRGDAFEKVAMGTGPYKLKEYSSVKTATFVRNESYWQPGKPYPNGVEVVFNLDLAAEYAAFVTKNLDSIHLNERPRVNELLRQVPDSLVTSFMGQLATEWYLKLDRPPFDDERVRRAIHLALDRQALSKVATFGDGMINPPAMPAQKVGWAIPQEELLKLPGYRQPKDQDMAEAKRLLAQAGYSGGLKTSLTLTKDLPGDVAFSEPVAAQLRELGIEVDLQFLTQADFKEREARGAYETIMPTSADTALDRQVGYLHSKGPSNKTGLSDPRLDRLLDDMTTLPELAARQRAAQEAQRYLVDKAYIIPLVQIPVYHVHQPWVKDHPFHRGNRNFIDMLNAARTWLDVDSMPPARRG